MKNSLHTFLTWILIFSLCTSSWAMADTRAPSSCQSAVAKSNEDIEKFSPTTWYEKLAFFNFVHPLVRTFKEKNKKKILVESMVIDVFNQVTGLFLSQLFTGEGLNLSQSSMSKLLRSYGARNVADLFRNGIHMEKQISNRMAVIVNGFYSFFFYSIANAAGRMGELNTAEGQVLVGSLFAFAAIWPLGSELYKRTVVMPFQYSSFPRESTLKRIKNPNLSTKELLREEEARLKRLEEMLNKTQKYLQQLKEVKKYKDLSAFEQIALQFKSSEESVSQLNSALKHMTRLEKVKELSDIEELNRIIFRYADKNSLQEKTFVVRDMHRLSPKAKRLFLKAVKSQSAKEFSIEQRKLMELEEELKQENQLIFSYLAQTSGKSSKEFTNAIKELVKREIPTEKLRLEHIKEEIRNAKANLHWISKLRRNLGDGQSIPANRVRMMWLTKIGSMVVLGSIKMSAYFLLYNLLIGDEEEVDEGLLKRFLAKFLLDTDPSIDTEDEDVRTMLEVAAKEVKNVLEESKKNLTLEEKKVLQEKLQPLKANIPSPEEFFKEIIIPDPLDLEK